MAGGSKRKKRKRRKRREGKIIDEKCKGIVLMISRRENVEEMMERKKGRRQHIRKETEGNVKRIDYPKTQWWKRNIGFLGK